MPRAVIVRATFTLCGGCTAGVAIAGVARHSGGSRGRRMTSIAGGHVDWNAYARVCGREPRTFLVCELDFARSVRGGALVNHVSLDPPALVL